MNSIQILHFSEYTKAQLHPLSQNCRNTSILVPCNNKADIKHTHVLFSRERTSWKKPSKAVLAHVFNRQNFGPDIGCCMPHHPRYSLVFGSLNMGSLVVSTTWPAAAISSCRAQAAVEDKPKRKQNIEMRNILGCFQVQRLLPLFKPVA